MGVPIVPRKQRVPKIPLADQPLDVAGYARVSTEEQARDGLSLIFQEDRIRAYCSLYGLRLARLERDAGVSAKSLERDGLAGILADLDAGRLDGMVILKLDRLTRRLADWSYLIDRYFNDKAGRRLFSVNDSIDTRTPSGRMVLNIIMTVAQWEREEIAYRTSSALQGKIARGERVGRIRFGYELGPDGRRLIPHEGEQKAIALMKEWQAQGKTYREMIAFLEELGIQTKEPGSIWRSGTIHRILTRPIP